MRRRLRHTQPTGERRLCTSIEKEVGNFAVPLIVGSRANIFVKSQRTDRSDKKSVPARQIRLSYFNANSRGQ